MVVVLLCAPEEVAAISGLSDRNAKPFADVEFHWVFPGRPQTVFSGPAEKSRNERAWAHALGRMGGLLLTHSLDMNAYRRLGADLAAEHRNRHSIAPSEEIRISLFYENGGIEPARPCDLDLRVFREGRAVDWRTRQPWAVHYKEKASGCEVVVLIADPRDAIEISHENGPAPVRPRLVVTLEKIRRGSSRREPGGSVFRCGPVWRRGSGNMARASGRPAGGRSVFRQLTLAYTPRENLRWT